MSRAAALKPGSPWRASRRVSRPAGADDPDAAARLLPAQVVAERDEVDEVVGMEVADDDRIDRRPDRSVRPAAGTSPGRGRGAGSHPASRSRYEAPVAPGRSVYAGPAPMTSSCIGAIRSPRTWEWSAFPSGVRVDRCGPRPWDRRGREGCRRCRSRGRLMSGAAVFAGLARGIGRSARSVRRGAGTRRRGAGLTSVGPGRRQRVVDSAVALAVRRCLARSCRRGRAGPSCSTTAHVGPLPDPWTARVDHERQDRRRGGSRPISMAARRGRVPALPSTASVTIAE